jgi:hypothetical protein
VGRRALARMPRPRPPRRHCAAAAAAPGLCLLLLCALRCGGGAAAFVCRSDRDAAACAALGALYASTGGASWGARVGWADAAAGRASDYCAFTGVTCSAGGNVTSLCVVITVLRCACAAALLRAP